MTAQALNRFEWFKAIMQVEGLSPTAKNVAGALAIQFANGETGQINPSQETVADYLKVHKDTVKRALRELRNAGWLMSVGDGGRGKSPMLRLLSPSKVIPIRAEKGGQIIPGKASERGAELHPQNRKRGEDLHQKGGGIVPPLYKEEQYKEQKGRAWAPFARHRFTGNFADGVIYLNKSKQYHELNAWAEWLKDHGLPRLFELPISEETEKSTIFALPYRSPPSREDQEKEALAYFTAMADQRSVHHAAQ